MERGSDKHSPRMDEAMSGEVSGLVHGGRDTRAEEFRSPEPSGEDQPDVDLAPDTTLAGGVPDGLTPQDVERRSELAGFLPPHTFPAVREVLVDAAVDNDAPDHVVDLVKALPAGREFSTVGEAYAVATGGHEAHRF